MFYYTHREVLRQALEIVNRPVPGIRRRKRPRVRILSNLAKLWSKHK